MRVLPPYSIQPGPQPHLSSSYYTQQLTASWTPLPQEWKKRVIITSDKTLVKGSMLIDDKMSISGFINPPEWEHVLFGRPYMNYHQNEINGRRTLHHWAKWRDLFTPEMLERVKVYAPSPSTSS
tara:strand:- start:17 stop:388 length:372 start_codon:yes stop_codon:yes gene_type:complete